MDRKNHRTPLVFLIMMGIWITFVCAGCRQEDPEALAAEESRQAQWRATMLEYGYPNIVIDDMEPAVKEQICRDQVYFHSAEVNYYRMDEGGRDTSLFYVGPSDHVEYPDMEGETSDYDLRTMLVAGTSHRNGELEYILCSFHYDWNTMPKDRKEDMLEITWDKDLLWSVDDSFGRSWSQIHKSGRREGLGVDHGAANLSSGNAKWYTEIRDLDRWGIQGMAGATWVQLRPLNGVDLTKEWPRLSGAYIYEENINAGLGMSVQHYDAQLQLRLFVGEEEIYEGN